MYVNELKFLWSQNTLSIRRGALLSGSNTQRQVLYFLDVEVYFVANVTIY